jgi:hypothetical protein
LIYTLFRLGVRVTPEGLLLPPQIRGAPFDWRMAHTDRGHGFSVPGPSVLRRVEKSYISTGG